MNNVELDHANYQTIEQFLAAWDVEYKRQAEKLDLFKAEITGKWNEAQRKKFIQLLYHQRGHFDDILWFMGNFSPDSNTKEMILENIRDEFGRGQRSHEKLYLDFARDMGVDLTDELIDEKFYLPFLKEYNKGQLRWLRDHDWNHRLVAFAAIERLDNVDYTFLKNIVTSFGVEKVDLVFFDAHIDVKHFDNVSNNGLFELWRSQAELVKSVFNFIKDYQLDIWKKILEAIIASKQ